MIGAIRAATLALSLDAAALAAQGHARAQTHAEQILDRLVHANLNRDHVMVVAHRGGRWRNGEVVLAENSLAAIDRAVKLGVEVVELDVRRTADGAYVMLHDETLDRTTTCTGALAEMDLAKVRTCRLVIEGTGEETQEVVPTLQEALALIDGRILMNVDVKLGIRELVNVVRIADAMGVADQLIVKRSTDTAEEVDAARAVLDAIDRPVTFMPVLDDHDSSGMASIVAAYDVFSPEAVEVIDRWDPGTPITTDGGLNFSLPAWSLAYQRDTHLWVNVLFQGGEATLSGGRGDPIAVGPGRTDEGWGFWVRAGATILQTDEPEALIEYLEANSYRRPYATAK